MKKSLSKIIPTLMILGSIYGYLVAILILVNILVCHLFSSQSALSWAQVLLLPVVLVFVLLGCLWLSDKEDEGKSRVTLTDNEQRTSEMTSMFLLTLVFIAAFLIPFCLVYFL